MRQRNSLMLKLCAVVLVFILVAGSVTVGANTVFLPCSDPATLNSLSVSVDGVNQSIPVAEGFKHTVIVPHSINLVIFSGTSLCCPFPTATFSLGGDSWLTITGAGGAAVIVSGLTPGANIFTITVVCSEVTNVYTITIIRGDMPQSNDATLSYLNTSYGTLDPAFYPDTFAYSVTVPHDRGYIEIIATPNHSGATVTGGGIHNLVMGANVITVTVTAQDGTAQDYAITVYRLSNDATLRLLTISPGTLSPAFNRNVFSYTVNVANSVTNVAVSALAYCDYATAVVISGGSNLAVGSNTVIVRVTAQDGTSRDYTITVYRAAPIQHPPDDSSNGNDSSYTPTPPRPPVVVEDDEEEEDEQDEEPDDTNDETPEIFVFEIPPYSLSATFSGAALLEVLENFDYLTLVRNRFSTSFSSDEISTWEFNFDSHIIMYLHSDVMSAAFADILSADPRNVAFLQEFIFLNVVIDDELVETYTIISVQIDDLDLTDTELERLVGVWLDEATGEFIIIEGYVSEDGNTFSFEAIASGVFGIMLQTPGGAPPIVLLPGARNSLVFTANSPIFILNGLYFLAAEMPFIDPETDRMMVPLRNVTNSIGVLVDWVPETRTVLILMPDHVLELEIDQPLPDGYGVPVIINDRTFVPLRFVMETFGATVEWDAENQSADISW